MQDTNFELDSMNLAEPYNMEAEQSVLGAALLDSERVMPALINTLKPEMFYSRQNAEIFSQMVELYSGTEQLDAVTLIDAVASTGVFESMEAAKVYIARLGEVVPSISNFAAYARIVEEKYLTRQVMQLAQNILKQSSAQPDAPVRSTTVTGIVAGIISRLAARTFSTQGPVLSAVSMPSSATVTIDGSLDETRSAAPGRSPA